MQANVGYLMFHSHCIASSDTTYQYTNETDCYELEIYFYYKLTPASLPSCPYECYSCLGPLSTVCSSCPDGRYLSAGRCLCPSGFYDPGSVVCLNCSLAISGCLACESASSCSVCQNGCTPLLFSPIYCDCPQQVQANFSYNCPEGYYFEPDTDSCQCSPLTYLNSTSGLC